jgi:hypothetical protein
MYNECAMVPEPRRAEMLHAIEEFLETLALSMTTDLFGLLSAGG